MNHISTDELQAFIEDDVRDTVRMRIEIHLGSCETCRNALDELCVAPVGTEATTTSEQELIDRLSKVAQVSSDSNVAVAPTVANRNPSPDNVDIDGEAVTTYSDGMPKEGIPQTTAPNGPPQEHNHFVSPSNGEKSMTKPLVQKAGGHPVTDYHPVVDGNPYVTGQSSSSIVFKILGVACILFFIGFMFMCVSYVGMKKSDSSDAYKSQDIFDPNSLRNRTNRNSRIGNSPWKSNSSLPPTDGKKPKITSESKGDSKGFTGRRVVLNPRTESPVDQMSSLLNNIVWDTAALKKQFDLGKMEYDYEKEQIHWGLRVNGNHKEYLPLRFQFLNKEGKKIEELSLNGNGIQFWPPTPPSNGGFAGVIIDLPAKSVLQKTDKVKVVESEF